MKMFIFNTNHRRHLTAGQGAAIAWDVMPMLKAEARERQLAGKGADGSGGRGNKKNLPSILTEGFEDNTNGESRDAAARLFNTSAGYISYAGRPQRCYSPTKSIKSVTSIGNPRRRKTRIMLPATSNLMLSVLPPTIRCICTRLNPTSLANSVIVGICRRWPSGRAFSISSKVAK
jgi:hypothetical protein